MEECKKFIEAWLARDRRDVAALSHTYGFSGQTAHKWLQRFSEGRLAGLADRSHTYRALLGACWRRWSVGSAGCGLAALQAALESAKASSISSEQSVNDQVGQTPV